MYKLIATSLLFFFIINNVFSQDYTTFGRPGNESFVDIVFFNNGSFAAAGVDKTKAEKSDDDISLHFFDNIGKVQSCHTFGNEASDKPSALSLTKDGDLLMLAQGHNDPEKVQTVIHLYKINKYGGLLWRRSYTGVVGYEVKEFSSGLIGLTGYILRPDRIGEYLFVLLDENSNEIFRNTYGLEYKDYAFGLTQTSDGGYLISGITGGFHSPEGHSYYVPDTDILFVKTDENGQELWQKKMGDNGHDFIRKMETDKDGNIYIVGSTQGDGNQSFDAFLMKIDEDANILWQQTIGGDDFEYGQDLAFDNEGNIFICGSSNSNNTNDSPDMIIAKFDAEGNELWMRQMGSSGSEYANAIDVDANNNCVVVGSTEKDGDRQYLLTKLNSQGDILSLSTIDNEEPVILFAPNPTRDVTSVIVTSTPFCKAVGYSIYSQEGKFIKTGEALANKLSINLSAFPAGVYVIEVSLSDGRKLTEQIVKI